MLPRRGERMCLQIRLFLLDLIRIPNTPFVVSTIFILLPFHFGVNCLYTRILVLYEPNKQGIFLSR